MFQCEWWDSKTYYCQKCTKPSVAYIFIVNNDDKMIDIIKIDQNILF